MKQDHCPPAVSRNGFHISFKWKLRRPYSIFCLIATASVAGLSGQGLGLGLGLGWGLGMISQALTPFGSQERINHSRVHLINLCLVERKKVHIKTNIQNEKFWNARRNRYSQWRWGARKFDRNMSNIQNKLGVQWKSCACSCRTATHTNLFLFASAWGVFLNENLKF